METAKKNETEKEPGRAVTAEKREEQRDRTARRRETEREREANRVKNKVNIIYWPQKHCFDSCLQRKNPSVGIPVRQEKEKRKRNINFLISGICIVEGSSRSSHLSTSSQISET